jgi:dTDP-4-dehydrorhamnose reductase
LNRAQKIAVTGTTGRLGRALLQVLESAQLDVVEWSRPEYDLDNPAAASRLVERDHPDVVVHAAAWTDVDGCARNPDLASRRNAQAVSELAAACAADAIRMGLVSTNEVFDGARRDGQGYRETDPPRPINPYGVSKLAGEELASDAFNRAGRSGSLLIVRTAWLYGPPGNDFPSKIIAAADRLPPDEPFEVVADEVGSPTYALDLARALVRLVLDDPGGGVCHLVNAGYASRLEVAQRVLAHCRPGRATSAISRAQFVRASTAPAWAVLENSRAAALGVTLRPWPDALSDYLASLC